MAASPKERRPRYVRQETTLKALTVRKRTLLQWVAECEPISLPQIARLSGDSEKATRRQMRPLYDAGLVDNVAIPRAALAEGTMPNDYRLLGGSAPNIYTITRAGAHLLMRLGLEGNSPKNRQYGPKNAWFLAHELAVRDVRIWLEVAARTHPTYALAQWQMAETAWIPLSQERTPPMVRPDAWFIYRLGEVVLVGLVEADRATERGGRRWREKVSTYTTLFNSDRLKQTTGYSNARVLVLVPTQARREYLATFLATHAHPAIAARFWLAERSVLDQPSLSLAVWQQPGSNLLRPLLPPTPEAQHG